MSKKQTVLIKFTGHNGRREVGEYVFDEANGHVCGVDLDTAVELITYPKPGQFAVVPGQKVSKSVIDALAEKAGANRDEIESLFQLEVNSHGK